MSAYLVQMSWRNNVITHLTSKKNTSADDNLKKRIKCGFNLIFKAHNGSEKEMLTADKSRLRSHALKYQLQFRKLLLNAAQAAATLKKNEKREKSESDKLMDIGPRWSD